MVIEADKWRREDGIRVRNYESYERYLEHQAEKLKAQSLSSHHLQLRERLYHRVRVLPRVIHGASVLCLGARTGAECEAFLRCGCFAVGIDINPGDKNRFVLYGDFQSLQFSDDSVDVVYSNALDHTFDFDKVISEAKRVLKQRGILIAELVRGEGDIDGRAPGGYACSWWDKVDEPVRRIEQQGFSLLSRAKCDYQQEFDQCVFSAL